MSNRSLPGLILVPAATWFVGVGFFMAGRPVSERTDAPASSAVPSLAPAPRSPGEEPFQGAFVTPGALLSGVLPPEKGRIRAWARLCLQAPSREDAARSRPSTPTPTGSLLDDALPSLRRAAAAGRLSAPTTAPPLFAV